MSKIVVIGKNRTAIPITTEVFGGKKRGRTHMANPACFGCIPICICMRCANALGIVFDYIQMQMGIQPKQAGFDMVGRPLFFPPKTSVVMGVGVRFFPMTKVLRIP